MQPRRAHGFTLIELLVALSVMAVLSVLSWRGIDSMMRTQEQTRQRTDALAVVQTALAQWRTDLDAQVPAAQVQPTLPGPLDWNGLALRIVRRSAAAGPAGLQVVAWSQRDVQGGRHWLRWQSPLLHTREELQSAWQQGALWAQNPGDAERRNEIVITPLTEWQIFYFRDAAWSHPLSSDAAAAGTVPGQDGAAGPGGSVSPDGVRLVLTLPPGQALGGTLTMDWIRPTLGGGKS